MTGIMELTTTSTSVTMARVEATGGRATTWAPRFTTGEREREREREVVRRLSGSWQRDCASPPSTCLGLRVAALGRMRESRGREREFETDGC
jgi:hypothetical protein